MGRTAPLTAEQRSLRASIAALTRWSGEDPTATAERGQKGLRDRFRREIAARYPDLAEAELERRAGAAYRAHMARLSLAASKARSRRAAELGGGAA